MFRKLFPLAENNWEYPLLLGDLNFSLFNRRNPFRILTKKTILSPIESFHLVEKLGCPLLLTAGGVHGGTAPLNI
jgi:hypothetical protein